VPAQAIEEDGAVAAEELAQVIEQVRERAARYRQELAASEALTRYALIDPILRALGWPLDDPAVVRPEYSAGQGKADYCLLGADGKPAVLIEAKTLGPKLPPITTAAVVGYAWRLIQQGIQIEYVGITNGLLWQIYRPFDLKQPAHTVDLGKGTAAEAAVEILRALWRPLLAGDSEPPPPPPPPPPLAEIPLSELRPVAGSPPPSALLLPDGTAVPLRRWRDLFIELAEMLVRSGRLRPDHCPVRVGARANSYLIHVEPVHASGRRFWSPGQLSNGLWIDKIASAQESARFARRLLEQFGEDPARYRVRPGQSRQQP
jgi:hypothetical protein